MLSNLLNQLTKEAVETNQAFGCQESLGDCSQSLAWSMLEVLETHHDPGDSAGSTVTALPLLLQAAVEGISLSENRLGLVKPTAMLLIQSFSQPPLYTLEWLG